MPAHSFLLAHLLSLLILYTVYTSLVYDQYSAAREEGVTGCLGTQGLEKDNKIVSFTLN